MFDVLNSISVHVLQLPTDKNGRILRTIKIDSGEEASLPAVTSSPSFATRLRNKGKIPKSLLLPVLANSYKTSRDTRLIA